MATILSRGQRARNASSIGQQSDHGIGILRAFGELGRAIGPIVDVLIDLEERLQQRDPVVRDAPRDHDARS